MEKIGFLLALLSTGWVLPLWACSCAPAPPVQKAAEKAQVIFEGRVLQAQDRALNPVVDADVPNTGMRYVLVIERMYKSNKLADTLVVYTGYGGGDCGFPFQLGEHYLVYAHNAQHDKPLAACYHVSVCSRTARLDKGHADERRKLGSLFR